MSFFNAISNYFGIKVNYQAIGSNNFRRRPKTIDFNIASIASSIISKVGKLIADALNQIINRDARKVKESITNQIPGSSDRTYGGW